MKNTEQTFSFKAPEAHRVLLAGDFTGWMNSPIPLRKQPDGVWRATALLTPGTHYYRFVVDGEWCDDPECTMHVQNPFGTHDNVVEVGSIARKARKPQIVPEAARVWGL